MSRLIDQLRESDYPDRGARDLTLEVGEWLESNKRGDVFNANPDFAQEYFAIKDEVSRAKRPSYISEFKGAFGSAVDELQASGYAIGALAADGARRIGVPGAEPVRNNLIRLMREQEDEAKSFQPSVPSYENISGAHPIEDTLRYVTQGLGTVAPSMLQAAASGLVGALAGSAVGPEGTIGGALMGLAERKLAQRAVSKLLERGIKTVTLEEAAKALPREAIIAEAKRLAVQYGGQAALAASSIGQEVGSIYADNPDAPGTAIAFGIPAGLLDVLPEAYVLSRFFKPGEAVKDAAANKALAYFKRFAVEAGKTVPMEGTTEAAQTLLEIAAGKYGRGEPATFTAADWKQAANAGIIGAIGGLGMAPVAAFGGGHAAPDNSGALADTVGSRLPLREHEMAAGGTEPMQFGGEIPEQDLIGRRTLGVGTQQAIAAEERVGFEGFNPGEAAPFAAGAAEPAPAEPSKAVSKAIARADEALGFFEESDQPPAFDMASVEALPTSGQITDAPLANLVGTQVEYQGYRGSLVRDREGNFMVLPPAREGAKPFWIEVAETGKDATRLASEVGITPLEPANMTPKPAPAVAVPGAAPRTSKVPLGEFFLGEPLAPRQDIALTNRTQSGEVLAAAGISTPNANAVQIESPTAIPVREESQGGEGVRVENQVIQPTAGASDQAAAGASNPAVVEPVNIGPRDEAGAAERDRAMLVEQQRLVNEHLAKIARPTDAQVAAATNGVKPLPADIVPNLRRLRIFERPKVAPSEEEGPVPTPRTVESQAVDENPLVALDKAVGKLGKGESNVAAVIIDNATGQAFVRGAYRGASNVLYVDLASTRKGTAVGKGPTVSAAADLLRGTEGRPATKLFAERTEDGQPRYTVWGIAELSKGGKLANWNVGPASALDTHPALQEAAKRWWTDEAKAPRPTSRSAMPSATADIEEFPQAMANWRRENPGEANAKAMVARIDEYAAAQNKKAGGRMQPRALEAWAVQLREAIEEMARVQEKQAVLLSADYTVPPSFVRDLFRSTVRALTESRDTDVVAFEQALMGAVNSAAKTTGMVIDAGDGRTIVAFALASMNGPVNADTILSTLHEAAHRVTDGLAEPLRVAFQEAVNRMSWFSAPDGQGRWLMNPRSLDIRLLANADPASLAPEQRAALEQLTPEEIAAAKRISPATLVEEQMAEHLAQFGWDRAEAKTAVAKFVRFVKELWLKLAMAVQSALKGPENISPQLARAYVENRFLQFIHRDSALARDRINDLLTWIGVKPTERQWVPYFPAGNDWNQRTQYVDIATGQLVPVASATFTPEAQTAYLKAALDNAARFVRENPNAPDTPQFRQTRRAAFNGVVSFTPAEQDNLVFAGINLEEEVYRGIAADANIRPFLPPGANFFADWLSLPEKQLPSTRRAEAEAFAKGTPDPLTGAAVAYDTAITLDKLGSVAETHLDADSKPVTVQLSSTQDAALKQTILALNDTSARVQRTIARENERMESLERQRKKNPADFPVEALEELDALKESIPLREKIAGRLNAQRNALLAKFAPGDVVHVYPGAEFFNVPSADATEAQIRNAPKGVVPRDLKFSDKAAFGAKLSDMQAWLENPANAAKGQIYGIIAEQYRKLLDIPVGLEAAATKAFLRGAPTGGIVDEVRATGLPSMVNLGKRFYEVTSITNRHAEDARIIGNRWSEAFGLMAKALGQPADQSFYERFWDPMMRVWENFDVATRGAIGTPEEGALFDRLTAAAKVHTGFDIASEPQRAALRHLVMASIENERLFRTIHEQHGLKVKDEELGVYRRLMTLGLVSGRRRGARHIAALFLRMNPAWSDTTPAAPGDLRTFWEGAADLYRDNRAAFDARMNALFEDYVLKDFADPIANNNVQIFDVMGDDGVPRKASLLRVRQAWRESGDSGAVSGARVTAFAEILHRLEGGKPDGAASTVRGVLAGFDRMFMSLKRDADKRTGAERLGIEVFARQMMDAREANDWPAEWVSYAPYDEKSNLILLHQLSWQAAFGPDPLSAQAEMSNTLTAARNDLAVRIAKFDDMYRAGSTLKDIEKVMGRDDFLIAKNAARTAQAINTIEKAFRVLTSGDNYLVQDFRTMNTLLGATAMLRLQNPRSGGINVIGDLGGPLVSLKLSTPALKGMKAQIETLARDIGNGVLEALGMHAAFNVEAAERLLRIGNKDSSAAVTFAQHMANLGPEQHLSQPSGYESPTARAGRLARRGAELVRGILPNLGSPLQRKGEVPLAPKLRAGVFTTTAQWTLNANTEVGKTVFGDVAARGVEYLQKIPAADRAQFVRELELGIRDLDAQQLGYRRGWLLNDEAAFAGLKDSIETKLPGESTVGRFVAKAYRRMEAAGGGAWETISDSQFAAIANLSATEWTLQPNVANMPYWMQGPLRPFFVFLTWPYLAMRKFGTLFTDPQGRMTWLGMNSTVADGMKALFVTIVPTTIAGSFAVDWYDKYILGKKQNLREASAAAALPGVGLVTDPLAIVERFGRYGRAGLAGDVVSQILNFDTQRNLSLDNRIVAVNTLKAAIDAMVSIPIQQSGNLTYASWGRQILNVAGAGGALQYLQILNNALDLNTQDAAINTRINMNNYLRAAARELNMPVRPSTGDHALANRVTPYLQQMELAALVNNVDLFREAYRSAVEQARIEHPEQPEKYVADNFNDRHPLRRLFRTAPSETDYRKMLGTMDAYGSGQVRAAVNSYNRFLTNWFGKRPYYGRADKGGESVEQLIRRATRINSDLDHQGMSSLAIP